MTQGPPGPPDDEVDFTDEEDEADFTDESDTQLPPGPRVADKIAVGRERIRGSLAVALVGLLVLLDAIVLILAALKVRPFDRDLLEFLLTGVVSPVIALVGTVLGFYFGEKAGKDTK